MALAYRPSSRRACVLSRYPVSFLQAVISRCAKVDRRATRWATFSPNIPLPTLVCDARCDVDPEKQDPQVRNLKLECIICPVAIYPPRARTRTRSTTSGKQDAERARCADDRFASLRRDHAERHGDGAPAATPAVRGRPRARTELRHPVAVQYHCIAL